MIEQGNDHAVSRLISKRAELAGMIAELEQEPDQWRADLTHIDGALRVLCPILTRRPSRRVAATCACGIAPATNCPGSVDTLRLAADEPLTAEEITIRIMAAKGLDARMRAFARRSAFRLAQF